MSLNDLEVLAKDEGSEVVCVGYAVFDGICGEISIKGNRYRILDDDLGVEIGSGGNDRERGSLPSEEEDYQKYYKQLTLHDERFNYKKVALKVRISGAFYNHNVSMI